MPDLLGAPGARSQPWFVRKADIDVVGHVNNAAIWSAVVQTAPTGLQAVDLVHHGPVEAEIDVLLSWWPGHLCLVTRADAARAVGPEPVIKVSAVLSVAAAPADD